MLYSGYTDEQLKNSLKNLRTRAKQNDFPVIEQVEKILKSRGYDITSDEFGPDVIGMYIKTMPGVQK